MQVAGTLISRALIIVVQALHHVVHIVGECVSCASLLDYWHTQRDKDGMQEKYWWTQYLSEVHDTGLSFLYESPCGYFVKLELDGTGLGSRSCY
jgi:hypothetical protein